MALCVVKPELIFISMLSWKTTQYEFLHYWYDYQGLYMQLVHTKQVSS